MHGFSASSLTTPRRAVPTMPLVPPHTPTQTATRPHDAPRKGVDGSAICGGLTQEKAARCRSRKHLRRCRQISLEHPSEGVSGPTGHPPDRVSGWNRWAPYAGFCPGGSGRIGHNRRQSREERR